MFTFSLRWQLFPIFPIFQVSVDILIVIFFLTLKYVNFKVSFRIHWNYYIGPFDLFTSCLVWLWQVNLHFFAKSDRVQDDYIMSDVAIGNLKTYWFSINESHVYFMFMYSDLGHLGTQTQETWTKFTRKTHKWVCEGLSVSSRYEIHFKRLSVAMTKRILAIYRRSPTILDIWRFNKDHRKVFSHPVTRALPFLPLCYSSHYLFHM